MTGLRGLGVLPPRGGDKVIPSPVERCEHAGGHDRNPHWGIGAPHRAVVAACQVKALPALRLLRFSAASNGRGRTEKEKPGIDYRAPYAHAKSPTPGAQALNAPAIFCVIF